MRNLFKRLRGGAIYSFADAAFSVLGKNNNNLAVALDCSITCHVSPYPRTKLAVLGEALSTSARTAAFLFKVYMVKDGGGSLIAITKGTLQDRKANKSYY